ncbi:MAG TPA: O-antigen ligase family protein [Planctomycetota bacterium]|nr:O-antigen ligase family protein [Planctomycetota bacterium]
MATGLSIALLGSLATNHSPGLTAGLMGATALLGLVEAVRGRAVPRDAWLLLLPFGYWALSFLLTRESLSLFFSMDFMRRDGALYVSLLPLAALAALPLDRPRLMTALLLYFAFQAAIAAVGGVSALVGWESGFYHIADVVDQKLTFFGLYKTHNATASVYLLLTLGAFAWALRPEPGAKLRATLLVLAALLALGCIMARSRGAFLALGAGVAFITFLAFRRGVPRRVMAAAVAGLAAAILAGGVLLLPRFVQMLGGETDTFRRETWSRAWGHFKRSPAVGIGYGRYNDKNHEFASIGIGQVAVKADVVNDDYHAHNSYLHWLAEGGVVGLAVMIAFWILVARGLKGDDPLRDGILAGIVAMAVLSLTEHYAGGGVFLTHLAFLIGVHQSRSE